MISPSGRLQQSGNGEDLHQSPRLQGGGPPYLYGSAPALMFYVRNTVNSLLQSMFSSCRLVLEVQRSQLLFVSVLHFDSAPCATPVRPGNNIGLRTKPSTSQVFDEERICSRLIYCAAPNKEEKKNIQGSEVNDTKSGSAGGSQI